MSAGKASAAMTGAALSPESFFARLGAGGRSSLLRFTAALKAQACEAEAGTSSAAAGAAEGGASFPSRLPFPEAARSMRRGGRSRGRGSVQLLAKRWVNSLFACYSFWELGCPRDRHRATKLVASLPPLSALQATFANNLLQEVAPFCSALRQVNPQQAGRSISNFVSMLEKVSAEISGKKHIPNKCLQAYLMVAPPFLR